MSGNITESMVVSDDGTSLQDLPTMNATPGETTTEAYLTDSQKILPGPLAIIYEVIGVIGVIGNLFVIIVILNSRLKQRVNNVLIAHQAVVDAVASALLIASSTVTSYTVEDGMPAADAYCRIWLTKSLLWGLMTVSSYTLVAISLERCLSTVQPVWHKMKLNPCRLGLMIATPWVVGLGYVLSTHLPVAVIENNTCFVNSWPNQESRTAFGVATAMVQFFIPLILIIYSYSHIASVIKQRVNISKSRNNLGADNQTQPSGNLWSKAHQNTLRTMLVVSICFVICWISNAILYLLINLRLSSDYNSVFYHFTVIMVFLNCSVNPFIYAYKYEQFRTAACNLFTRFSKTGIAENTSIHSLA